MSLLESCAIHQTFHQVKQKFYSMCSLVKFLCGVFPTAATGCVSLCVCRCKVPLSRFGVVFSSLDKTLGRHFLERGDFNYFLFFPSAFQPLRAEKCGCVLVSLWPEAGASSAALPGFCHTLFWSSLDIPCTRAALHCLFKPAVHCSTRIREKLCPVVKMLFHMDNCGRVSSSKPLLKLCCGSSKLGAGAPTSLKRSSWHANALVVNAIATFPKN